MRFAKGHGTENDFVLLPDPDGLLDVSAAAVAALCDRRAGIGGDGMLRVVRSAADPAAAAWAGQAEWFMDYRNADGSIAEMCGNGVRVYVRYLLEEGLAELAAGEVLALATRGGVRFVRLEGSGDLTVDMGVPADVPGDVQVAAAGRSWSGTGLTLPNPHAIAFVDDLSEAGELAVPPVVTPPEAYPEGVNVEFVVPRAPAHIAMRVHERGVGETRSCGTGAAAAAVAAMRRDEVPAGTPYTVDVPGGRLSVVQHPDGTVFLSGPAVIVARGELDTAWASSVGLSESAPA